MKGYKIFIAAFIILFASCQKNSPDGIMLFSPENHAEVEPCCINFQWTTDLDTTCLLSLSTKKDFSNSIVDTVIIETSGFSEFVYSHSLEPGARYYWRIKQGNREEISTFQIEDVISKIIGTHIMNVKKTFWHGGSDSTINSTGTVTISRNGANLNVNYAEEGISRIFQYNGQSYLGGDSSTVSYWSHTMEFGHTAAFFDYNYVTGAVRIHFQDGGHGGGVYWNLTGPL